MSNGEINTFESEYPMSRSGDRKCWGTYVVARRWGEKVTALDKRHLASVAKNLRACCLLVRTVIDRVNAADGSMQHQNLQADWLAICVCINHFQSIPTLTPTGL